ncbi:MAG TPA: response regulator, partial [Holophaga sp.]|nr:response regulator [Holophaga sp.]
MSNKGIIHIIDDEPVIHDVLAQLLTSEGYEVESSSSGEEALEKFPSQSFDVILLDLLMPGMDGIEVLRRIKRIDPLAAVIIITAYGSVESAISAMKIGALDYVQKPFKHDDLLLVLEKALERKRLQDENVRLRDELRQRFGFANIIGKSQGMQNVFDLVKAAAPTRSTILLQGESGTGKELVARAIHM